jgi:L-seryl-tRNA(Ser) seleniumtransferase
VAQDAPDPRRSVPRTDTVLADPRLQDATRTLGRGLVRTAVAAAQDRVRAGDLAPGDVVGAALDALPARATTLHPVLNATGVVLHTNLGRAPLSAAAREALVAAAGTVDVELDLATGRRGARAPGARDALLAAVPEAQDALVVNNGAAALVLATTALAAGAEVVVSRGELVEIGDGFRLPDLITSCGARLREVGTTNRSHLADYADAVGPGTGAVLKVHPSNFAVSGFTSAVPVADLVGLGAPVVHDIGSGLLRPHPLLPDEPDAATSLRDGAAVVTCSGDKLLGGPQAGLVLGRRDVVQRLRRHPLARALRPAKTTLAALEATLRGPLPPAVAALEATSAALEARCAAIAATVAAAGVAAEVVPSAGRLGGGSAPGLRLDGWAVALPEDCAALLRRHEPAVLARVEAGRTLLDVRALAPEDDAVVATAVVAVSGAR